MPTALLVDEGPMKGTRKCLSPDEQRAAQGMRQAMAAQRCSLGRLAVLTGIPKGTLQGIVGGTHRTTLPRYVAIARALDIPQAALLPTMHPRTLREEIVALLPVLDDHFLRALQVMLTTYLEHHQARG